MKDLLIIGGGFAGLCCAWEAQRNQLSYTLIDNQYAAASTRIAAGIVNPITGRKYQLQENFDVLHAHAIGFYTALEHATSTRCMHPLPIFKMHKSEAALEAWQIACATHGIPELLSVQFKPTPWMKHLDVRFGALMVENAFRIDTLALREAINQFGHSVQAQFTYDDLHLHADHVLWQQQAYAHVLFCEGYQVSENPWFRHIHIRPSKGECALVRIPHLQSPCILQKQLFIVPYGDDLYWVGGTNDHSAEEDSPSAEKLMEIEAALRDTMRLPFEIVAHYAAIRPTMRDRRPAVGTHPMHKQLHVLNGLGTKGALLGPYHAHMLIESIFHGGRIDKRVDVSRFPL